MADIERKEQEVPKYVKVREVMQLCEVSESRAYRIMQQLNKELEAQGFVTTSGRVSRKYLMPVRGVRRVHCHRGGRPHLRR